MRRENRLRAPKDFSHVYRTGSRAHTETVVVRAAVDDGRTPRVGFTCSKRAGNAVTRNRVKRRLRAATEPLVDSLRPGSQVVLQATPSAASVSWQKLVDDVSRALGAVGALDA